MFTGIVEEIGKIKNIKKLANGCDIEIVCKTVLSDIKLGDSICVNGCCQTVVNFSSDSFSANLSDETLKMTNFLNLKTGDEVNLERALKVSDRFGGHIVQGHIDGQAKFINIEKLSDFYDLFFEVDDNLSKYIVQKGSIAINGVSLTVSEINSKLFKVSIIPHTYSNTTLKSLNSGDFVNIETDILGRYVEKFLCKTDNESKIDENFLKENGF